jgi:hypothetical protein
MLLPLGLGVIGVGLIVLGLLKARNAPKEGLADDPTPAQMLAWSRDRQSTIAGWMLCAFLGLIIAGAGLMLGSR